MLPDFYEYNSDLSILEVDPGQYNSLIGKPGEFPFTRGIHAEMYTKGRFPTVRKYGGFGGGADLNKHLKSQIELGVTGLSIAYDLPTQMGYDPDHPMAMGEVGVNGVSVACLKDYEAAFEAILPAIVEKGIGVSKTINATAPILLAFYVAAAKRQGVDPKNLRGTIQNDVLKEYLSRNTHIYPLGGTLRLVRDVFLYCKDEIPKFNTISICGYHMREKGAGAVGELAYMFANAIQYAAAATSAGMSVDDLAPQISFFINVKKNFMEEIAKLRAARRIWASIARDGLGAKDERSMKFRVQAYTGGSDLRAEKPQLNIIRDAVRTLAAILGGPQGVNTTSFDEAITIPTALSQAIAIDTPYIALLEKGVTSIADPAGGSYYLESLTNEIERGVWKELEKISAFPSYQKALSHMRAVLEDEAYREQLAEDGGKKLVAGKNIALENAKLYPKVPLFKPGDPSKLQKERLNQFVQYKQSRDQAWTRNALDALKAGAKEEKTNLMPLLVSAVEAKATLGEISDALREVFGTADASEPWNPCAPVAVFTPSVQALISKKNSEAASWPQPRWKEKGRSGPMDLPYVIKAQEAEPSKPVAPKPFDAFKGLSVNAYLYRESGCTAAQEAALALHKASKSPKSKKLCLRLSSHNDFFEEIAKFRAIRRVWSRKSKTPLILCARSASDTFTRQKPWNNIVRSALQGLQAVLAGVDYLEIISFDRPFGPKTEWSAWARQMNKDVHLMLQHEFGALDVADPLAGSFYLEILTYRMEQEIEQMLRAIDALPPGKEKEILAEQLPGNGRRIVGVNAQVEGPSPKPKIFSR